MLCVRGRMTWQGDAWTARGSAWAGNIREEPGGVLRPANDLRLSCCPILREHTGAPAACFLCWMGVGSLASPVFAWEACALPRCVAPSPLLLSAWWSPLLLLLPERLGAGMAG